MLKQKRSIYIDDEEDEASRVLVCGNLDGSVTEDLLYELFLQAGPIESARIAHDKNRKRCSFGFVTYIHECIVPYAVELYRVLSLYSRKLIIRCTNSFKKKSISTPGRISTHSLDYALSPGSKHDKRTKHSLSKKKSRPKKRRFERRRRDSGQERGRGRNFECDRNRNYEYDRGRRRHYKSVTRRKSD